jgi:hypothetical protein
LILPVASGGVVATISGTPAAAASVTVMIAVETSGGTAARDVNAYALKRIEPLADTRTLRVLHAQLLRKLRRAKASTLRCAAAMRVL